MNQSFNSFSKFDPSQVEKYVRNILKQSMPGMDMYGTTAYYDTEMTEQAQHIVVRIYIADPLEARRLRFHVAPNQVKLERIGENQPAAQRIQLPQLVIPASCKAVYKDGMLRLQIRKQEMDELYHEVHVKYI